MKTVATIAPLKAAVAEWRRAGRRIAFVPTMGNLHAGHQQLMVEARRHADVVVASLYVNPLQFGPSEDFAAYPRTPDEDATVLAKAGVDLLFCPDETVMYPRGRAASTRIEVPGVSDILCGASRPGHFRGVATVVNRLFHLVSPDVALFGKKDYQQLLVIRLMTADFGLPIEIVGVETVRAESGLALSSRNGYLTEAERDVAARLYATLQTLARQIRDSGYPPGGYSVAETIAARTLAGAGFRPDYVSVRRQEDLGLPATDDRKLVILAAAWLGRARLIDNLEVELNPDT